MSLLYNDIHSKSNYLEIFIGDKINNKKFKCREDNYTNIFNKYKKLITNYYKKVYYHKDLIYSISPYIQETYKINHLSTKIINNNDKDLLILNNNKHIVPNSNFSCSYNYNLEQLYSVTEIFIANDIKLLFFNNIIKIEVIINKNSKECHQTLDILNKLFIEL